MSYKIAGESESEIGFGLAKHSTSSRLAYTPENTGTIIFDTDLNAQFLWNGADWNSFILDNDSRLTNSRTPLAHTHSAANITSGTIANARISASSVTQHTDLLYVPLSGNVSIATEVLELDGSAPRIRLQSANTNIALIEFISDDAGLTGLLYSNSGNTGLRHYDISGSIASEFRASNTVGTFRLNEQTHTIFSNTTIGPLSINKLRVGATGTTGNDISEIELASGSAAVRIASSPNTTSSYTVRMPTDLPSVGDVLKVGSMNGQIINMIWAAP